MTLQGRTSTGQVAPLQANSLTPITGYKQPNDVCPTNDNFHDVRWIARITAPLDSTALGNPQKLAASLILTEGKLRSIGFRQRMVGPARFEYPKGSAPAAITEDVEFTHTFTDAAITGAQLTSAAGNITLVSDNLGMIKLKLVNLPLPDIQEIRDPTTPKDDSHFLEFYKLTSSTGDFPVEKGECQTPVGSVANPKCPPAFFY